MAVLILTLSLLVFIFVLSYKGGPIDRAFYIKKIALEEVKLFLLLILSSLFLRLFFGFGFG